MGTYLGQRPKGLAGLRPTASKALSAYTDPASHFAFHTYDRLGDPDEALTPADVLLANLLSLRLGWREVIPLFSTNPDDRAAHDLRQALDRALVTLRGAEPFEAYPSLRSLEEAVVPLIQANEAAKSFKQWTHVTVSKVLHRRLPHIVPIIDSRVQAFYGARGPQSVRTALWDDVSEHQEWLGDLASQYPTPDKRPMSVLRCADILIWSAS